MAVFTIRPTSAGDLTEIFGQIPDSGAHWDKVDEVATDEDSSYVHTQTGWGEDTRDLYNLGNSPELPPINITNVKVYARVRNTSAIGTTLHNILVRTGGVTYLGGSEASGLTYSTISFTWTNNPNTGAAWTIAQIDALQAGIRINASGLGSNEGRCSQVYVEVTYTVVPLPFEALSRATSLIHIFNRRLGTFDLKVGIGGTIARYEDTAQDRIRAEIDAISRQERAVVEGVLPPPPRAPQAPVAPPPTRPPGAPSPTAPPGEPPLTQEELDIIKRREEAERLGDIANREREARERSQQEAKDAADRREAADKAARDAAAAKRNLAGAPAPGTPRAPIPGPEEPGEEGVKKVGPSELTEESRREHTPEELWSESD